MVRQDDFTTGHHTTATGIVSEVEEEEDDDDNDNDNIYITVQQLDGEVRFSALHTE